MNMQAPASVSARSNSDSENQPGLTLLSIDGGGIRGLSSLIILREILYRMKMRDNLPDIPRPCDMFDLAGASGTGGLIAVMLFRLRMTIDEAIETYVQFTQHVFSKKRSWWKKEAFSANKFERAILDILKRHEHSVEMQLLDRDWEGRGKAFLCAYSAENMALPVLFRTYEVSKNPSYDCTIVESARATCATPKIFKGIDIGPSYLRSTYIGGEWRSNNPIQSVLSEANVMFPSQQISCLLSLGTGKINVLGFDLFSKLSQVLKRITQDCERTHQRISEQFDPAIYFRLNVDQSLHRMSWKDWKHLTAVEVHSKQYLMEAETSRRVDLLVEKLLKPEVQPQIPTRARDSGYGSVGTPHLKTARDADIYRSQLLLEKRGSPLWIPGPNMRLPKVYRKTGVAIGDVGILNAAGGFDFLFNIFCSADDIINEGLVPADFFPLDIPNLEVNENSYLASRSFLCKSTDSSHCGFIFETSAKEGAILVLPDGALSQDLRFHRRTIAKYISANARMWYEHAQGDKCGLEIHNGDLRIVCGIDKATSWAIATFATDVEGPSVQLEFKATDPGASETYRWETVGRARGRVGPPQAEMRDLMQATNEGSLQNQCLFVRTFNFNFSGNVWDELGVTPLLSSSFENHNSDRPLPTSHPPAGPSTQSNPGPQYNGGNTNLNQAHLSLLLNMSLLEKHPDAAIVVTEDADWISTITEKDITFPGPEVIRSRVLASRETSEEGGVVTLKAEENVIGEENLGPVATIGGDCTRDVLVANNNNECQSLRHRQGSDSVKHQESGLPPSAENLVKDSILSREDITRHLSTVPDTVVVKSSFDSNDFSKGSDDQIPKRIDFEAEHESTVKNDHRHTGVSSLRSTDLSHHRDVYRYTSKRQRTASSSTLSLYSNEGSERNDSTTYFHPGGSVESIADSGIFIGHNYRSKAPHHSSTSLAAATSQSNLSQYSKDVSEGLGGKMPGDPHSAGLYRRCPSLSHVGGVPREGLSSHIVNRLGTEGHPNLAQQLNEESEVIDSHPREYDEISSFQDVHTVMIHGATFNMAIDMKSGLQILNEHIVRGAEHDSIEGSKPPGCYPGTRKTILREIWSWIDDHNSDTRILSLYGQAGAGKTAIAVTLREGLKAAGRLGGDYFFSRNARKDATLLFPTISHYLATTFPSAREAVERAFAKDRDVLYRTTDIQLQRLIIEPLLTLDPKLNVLPLVIVIDGLDECEGQVFRIIEQIFSVYHSSHSLPLRFVITSRPGHGIRKKFTSEPICQLLQVSAEETPEDQDIRMYLESRFKDIRDNPSHQNRLSNITLPWPSPSDLDQLVEMASGLFIYAVMVLKFVSDPHAMPDERLKLVLSLRSEFSPKSAKPITDLDRLYKEILSMIPLPNRAKAKAILGAVLYVSPSTTTYQNEALSITELLLGLKAGESYSVLDSVHSLFHIPQSFGTAHRDSMTPEEYKVWMKDGRCAVRFYHQSFPDFLGNRTRSGEYFVDKNTVNAKLAVGCIKILQGLSAEHVCSRLYCVAWNYAAMQISDHCSASGPLNPELLEVLKQFDVFACFAPMFLNTHGYKIGPEGLENIEKKVARQRLLAELFSRHKLAINSAPLDKDITGAMKLLAEHDLMISADLLLTQLRTLSNWFKHSKYPPHLSKELDIILNEIRSTRLDSQRS